MNPELCASLEQRLGTKVRAAKRLSGGDINEMPADNRWQPIPVHCSFIQTGGR